VKKKRGVPDVMSGTLFRSVCGILCGQQKSAKPYSFKKLPKSKENTRNPKISGVVLELLTRFELVTSSLPIIYELFSLVVSCCTLLPRSPYISGDAGFFLLFLVIACCILK
jgi:hypothetical protein